MPDKIKHYYGKEESLWGLKIHRLGRGNWNFEKIQPWLVNLFGQNFSIINYDRRFINILIWGKAFVINSPFFDFNEKLYADIIPYLSGTIKKIVSQSTMTVSNIRLYR